MSDFYDMNAVFSVYLDYLGGGTPGSWMSFPCDEDDLVEWYNHYGNRSQDYCMSDCESNIKGFDLFEYLGQWPSLDALIEINEFAERYEGLSTDEQMIVDAALMWMSNSRIEDAFDYLNSSRVWHDCDDMTDVARRVIDEYYDDDPIQLGDAYSTCFNWKGIEQDLGYEGVYTEDPDFDMYEYVDECWQNGSLPDLIKYWFDYKQFGRDLSYEGTFVESDGCMIELID